MKSLLSTIKYIVFAKTHKLNRILQVSNCIDLVSEHQVNLAKSYKQLTKSINDLKFQLHAIETKEAKEKNSSVKLINQKNIAIINSTLSRLNKNKQMIEDKILKLEDSKVILLAKKDLLESIELFRNTTSNGFESHEFDIDSIMNEIDKNIRDIESELQANDELNALKK